MNAKTAKSIDEPARASEHPQSPQETSAPDDIDLSLLEYSLTLTPWERMKANDDAVNFADTLHAAMQQAHAKSD